MGAMKAIGQFYTIVSDIRNVIASFSLGFYANEVREILPTIVCAARVLYRGLRRGRHVASIV